MDFSINSKFYHFMNKVADLMILSGLWFVTSLPIFTIGASCTALYYCVVKVVRQENGSAFKSYFQAFRSNFKQSTIIFLLVLAASLLMTAIGSAVYAIFQAKSTLDNIYLVYLVALIFTIAWLHYIFSYIARFQAPLKTVLKNSLVICLVNLPSSLSMVILFAVVIVGFIMSFPSSAMTIFLIPGIYALISSFLLEKIYRKYADMEEETCVPED